MRTIWCVVLAMALAGVAQADFSFGNVPCERVEAATPVPDDFDAFWREAIAALDRDVPADLRLEKWNEKSDERVTAYRISCAGAKGTRTYGYYSVPNDRSRRWPLKVTVPGAGNGAWANNFSPSADRARLFVSVFPFAPDPDLKKTEKAFAELERGLKARWGHKGPYTQAGLSGGRTDYFFYVPILGVNRMVSLVAARPEIDRTDISYGGESQGGYFGLILSALNPNLRYAAIGVPGFCDWLGCERGRRSGSGHCCEMQRDAAANEAAKKNAGYYDGCSFASRIRIPVGIIAGGVDQNCAPESVYAAFNRIPTADKRIFYRPDGTHHSACGPFWAKIDAWARTVVASPRSRAMRRLRKVAESDSFYWAWTHPWLEVWGWNGDASHAVKGSDGSVAPKATKDVRLTSVYQKYSGGKRPLIAYSDMACLVGTWHSPRYYETNRASLTAAIRRYWRELGGIMVFSWHMDQPYCTNGFKAASYRFKSTGENRNVIRQILDGTGGPCGTDTLERKNHRPPCANPKEWYMRQLRDVVTFLKGLVDEETGERIPVVLRYGHECDGDWFWWGRTWCSADEFRRFSRMTADYLRKECGDEQILFAYTPDRTWKEFGKEGDADNTFLAYYPGDAYVDILGLDDYSIGNGDDRKVESNFNETVRKLRLMTDFASDRGKVVCISESGGNHKRDDFWQWFYRVATADGVKVAFADTWSGEWGTLPATPASEADEKAFAARKQVLMEDSGKGFREMPDTAGRIGPPDFDAYLKQAIFDAIASKEKYVIECPGMTHKVFPEVEKGLNAWVRSRTLKVNESAVPGDDPSIAVSGEFHDPRK